MREYHPREEFKFERPDPSKPWPDGYPFTNEAQDYDIKCKLTPSAFMAMTGFCAESRGSKYVSAIEHERYREGLIVLEISNYHGSIGAQHYYGKLRLPELRWTAEANPRSYTYSGDLPKFVSRIELNKLLVADDFVTDSKKRGMDPERRRLGEPYHGFWTMEAVKERATEIVREWFPGFGLGVAETYCPVKEWLIKCPRRRKSS